MAEIILKAEVREGLGKEASKKLRKLGKVPAVFYQKQKAQALLVNEREFSQVLRSGEQLIELNIDGKKKKALIKDIQYHPVTEAFVHVDFQGVSMSEIVLVSVPLDFIGTPAGVREGGQIEVNVHELEVRCKASDIPNNLEINIEALDIGDNLHVASLDFGDIEVVSSPELLIASVVAPKLFDEDEEEEVVEGEEGAEESEEETEE
ncbi:MAG: 50S ribosomal protein L25 [Candidatus Neomarinimicrobiota bacterium]|jgi:large subunit ribosomal protein L25